MKKHTRIDRLFDNAFGFHISRRHWRAIECPCHSQYDRDSIDMTVAGRRKQLYCIPAMSSTSIMPPPVGNLSGSTSRLNHTLHEQLRTVLC